MAKRIEYIPANNKFKDELSNEIIKKKKVCAYARVSTNEMDQENSYDNQINEYTKTITNNPHWEFVGVYADKGISGTSIDGREQFKKMIEDCRSGKIDLILTKSISRFSRNTIDCLKIVRELRGKQIEIFFEKENLYSSDSKTDFILSILSSVAQEEARNTSENIKWSIRRGYSQGKFKMQTGRFLGYNKNENGELIVDIEDAKTVKIIYNLYMCGYSYNNIVFFLEEMKRLSGVKREKWNNANIGKILKNEKYKGDVLLQKTVVLDYLTHKSVTNKGQEKQYYINENHEPIIPRDIYDYVQNLSKERNDNSIPSALKNFTPFNENYLPGLVYCGKCHDTMGTAYVSIKNKERYFKILKCSHNKRNHGCYRTIRDEYVKKVCDDYVYQLYDIDKENIIHILIELMNKLDILNDKNEKILCKLFKTANYPKVSYYRNKIGGIIVEEGLSIKILENMPLFLNKDKFEIIKSMEPVFFKSLGRQNYTKNILLYKVIKNIKLD